MSKAAYLLHYHSLKKLEGESGAEFVDREQREYLALQQMGINMDDSLRLTKFIQQETNNSKKQFSGSGYLFNAKYDFRKGYFAF